jgi:hypothetical protein
MATSPRAPRPPAPSDTGTSNSAGKVIDAATGSYHRLPQQHGGAPERGSRKMKEYYLYDSDFRDLARTGLFATICFTIASACLGFAINIHKDLAFNAGLAAPVIAEWTAYRTVAIGAGIVAFIGGVILTLSGYSRVEQLKAETSHGTDTYVPRKWYMIALVCTVGLAILGAGIWIGARVL